VISHDPFHEHGKLISKTGGENWRGHMWCFLIFIYTLVAKGWNAIHTLGRIIEIGEQVAERKYTSWTRSIKRGSCAAWEADSELRKVDFVSRAQCKRRIVSPTNTTSGAWIAMTQAAAGAWNASSRNLLGTHKQI
jgi:hypothetical protein